MAAACNKDWYGGDCNVFCQPQDGAEGHFDCEEDTGKKLCQPGMITVILRISSSLYKLVSVQRRTDLIVILHHIRL